MKRRLALLTTIFFLPCAVVNGGEIYLPADEVEAIVAKEGQKVVVFGDTGGSEASASGTQYVRFPGSDFYLVTFKSDLDAFGDGEPSERFDEKRIAVEGVISIYQGNPQIKLVSPDQVTLLAADEVFPPVATEKPEAPMETKPEAKPEPTEKPEEEPKKKPPVDASEFFD